MSNAASKPIRSPSYPSMPLREALEAVGKIENLYRSSPVDRTEAAKLIGYSSLSGPANKALAALASYGLLERAGKGETRVTQRARAILHAANDKERKQNLLEAASEPPLFRELQERFKDLSKPPEEGVVTYLNRQGFNPNAIRPAAKAFLQTIDYVGELRASESHVLGGDDASESESPDAGGSIVTYGEARVGDLVQWESGGVLQLQTPLRVRHVAENGEWVFVEGSETGIPMDEVVVEKRAAEEPPTFPLAPKHDTALGEDESEWMRNTLGPATRIRLLVKGDMGPKEIGKLIRLLRAQREILLDEDEDEEPNAKD